MYVKICGITTQQAAETAIQSGADLLGFVFAPSKRRITPEAAAMITKHLPPVKKVGVFVNESREHIETIAEQVGLDYIQLHGDETPAFARSLSQPVIKAFPASKTRLADIHDYPCDYDLLDSPYGGGRGGNGSTFDWSLLQDSTLDKTKLILAGGLTPENVQTAIATVHPIGVDVSSGVETDGQKDMMKIQQFIKKAKG